MLSKVQQIGHTMKPLPWHDDIGPRLASMNNLPPPPHFYMSSIIVTRQKILNPSFINYCRNPWSSSEMAEMKYLLSLSLLSLLLFTQFFPLLSAGKFASASPAEVSSSSLQQGKQVPIFTDRKVRRGQRFVPSSSRVVPSRSRPRKSAAIHKQESLPQFHVLLVFSICYVLFLLQYPCLGKLVQRQEK